jgi:antitoxin VapB
MHITKAFNVGNFQAIRIPAELAYERTDIDVEIGRCQPSCRQSSLSGSLF